MASSARGAVSDGHTFHIPVMGTGFSLDTPLRVAPYGISSVVSLVDDVLIEQLRRYHCERFGLLYSPIGDDVPDSRAARITEYLNLLHYLTQAAFELVRGSSFDSPKGIRRYYELLPNESPRKQRYYQYLAMCEGPSKRDFEQALRCALVPGSIDVNIMAKVDRSVDKRGFPRADDQSDAVAALRGYAKSTLESGLVLSAGMNPRLLAALGQYEDFFAQGDRPPKKRLILKVSDLRSAHVQGKLLARRGLWPSEFRVESGLNCGGHAFPTHGSLLGPILEEFKQQRAAIELELGSAYRRAMQKRGVEAPAVPGIRITVQGGLGTASEHRLMLEHYQVDGTGWGSPFLMVPEVTNVDPDSLERLKTGSPDDIQLTWASPLGLPFWSLKHSASDRLRQQRISAGKPGSDCPKGYVARDTTYGEVPLCTASRRYQRRRLEELGGTPGDELEPVRQRILEPQCICHNLGGGLVTLRGLATEAHPAICPGPNLRYFRRELSLDEMVGHIYGRNDVRTDSTRPHVFINELVLYLGFLKARLGELYTPLRQQSADYYARFRDHLLDGVKYYERVVPLLPEPDRADFLRLLRDLHREIGMLQIPLPDAAPTPPDADVDSALRASGVA